MNLAHIESEIRRLAELKANWDSYGAPPIDKEVIAAAYRVASHFPTDMKHWPRVVPMSTGELQFEWIAHDVILEIEIECDEVLRYMKSNGGGYIFEDGMCVADELGIRELIQWFQDATK